MHAKDKELVRIQKKITYYAILCIMCIILLYAGYIYYHNYFYVLKSPVKVKEFIMSYGKYSVFAFLFLQIIQVIIFFIPGEIVQIAGGFIFSTLKGSLLSLLGITIGSMITYGIARIFGKPFIEKIISRKKLKYTETILSLGSINYIVFLLYLIPGLPKDILGYVCGVSNMSFKSFMFYSTLGRIPALVVSAYFGAKLSIKNIGLLAVIALITAVIFLAGFFYGEKILRGIVHRDKGKKSSN